MIGTSGDTGYTQCLPHLHFARQYQGGPVTESVPVYFQGYAKQEFHVGEYVEAQTSPCPAPSDDAAASSRPAIGTFCGSYFADALDVLVVLHEFFHASSMKLFLPIACLLPHTLGNIYNEDTG